MYMDIALFEWINQWAGQNQVMDQLVMLLSKFGPVVCCFPFVWLWFTRKGNRRQNRMLALFAIAALALALGMNKVIEMIYFRPRPFTVLDVNLLSDKSALDPSFPSNHSTGAFTLAFILFWKRKKTRTILLVFAALIALSRLYIGVHYPTDIAAGAIVALLVTFILMRWPQMLQPMFSWALERIEKVEKKLQKAS